MKFNGTITNVLPELSGTSQSGKVWRKRAYVCVYDNSNEQYPKSIVFDVMGDKIEQLNLQRGGQYELDVDFEAKEWNSRYFMSATCWRATAVQSASAPTAQPIAPQQQPQPQAVPPVDPYAAVGMPQRQVAAPQVDPNADALPF